MSNANSQNDSSKQTLQQLKNNPIVPVIVLDDANDALPLAEALLEGGLNVIEITMRTAAAVESMRLISQNFPDMLVGAGTVVSQELAQNALDSGATFGLAPGLNPDIIQFFKSNNALFIPGVMTPTELEKGMALGCEMFKFFPAEQAGGSKFLKSFASPYESFGISFCPTGGLTLTNMGEYLALPTVSNIGGTWLATRDQVHNKEWSKITEQVKQAVQNL